MRWRWPLVWRARLESAEKTHAAVLAMERQSMRVQMKNHEDECRKTLERERARLSKVDWTVDSDRQYRMVFTLDARLLEHLYREDGKEREWIAADVADRIRYDILTMRFMDVAHKNEARGWR